MPTTYIAGHDGSDAAGAALRFTTRLADAEDGEVIAANVYLEAARAFGKGASDGAVFALDEQSRIHAGETFAQSDVPDGLRRVFGARSAAEGLHRLAEDEQAALLAVGVTHRGALGRIVPGSVGEHLLHGAPCPVAVVPAGWPDNPVHTVAVAYDDGEASKSALRAGADLARRLGARLVLLAVVEPIAAYAAPGVALPSRELDDQRQLDTTRAMEQVLEDLSPDLHTEMRVIRGRTAQTLIDACRDDVDLLVMGSRGYGPARSVLLGSVSRWLVDHAPCPVLVVPRRAPTEAVAEPATLMA